MTEFVAILPHLFPIVGAVFSFLFMTTIILILMKGIRNLRVSELFEFGGEVSLTKFWQNVAYAAATIAFLAVNISGNLPGGSVEVVWFIYLGVVASNAVLSKWISVKYDRMPPEQRGPQGRYGGEYGPYYPPRGGWPGQQKRGGYIIPDDARPPSKVDAPD